MVAITGDDRSFIGSIGRDLVAELAPGEVAMYPATSEVFFEDPAGAVALSERDDPLGFGIEIISVLTPFVLSVLTAVVEFLGPIASRLAGDAVTEAAKDALVLPAVKRLFRTGEAPSAPPPSGPALSADDVRAARQAAFDQATTLGISEEQAGLLADAIAGRLVCG
jgi:hypothetical protein